MLQFLKVVKENYSSETYIAFRILAFTGIRLGELRALTWKDINFKKKTLTISKNMMNIGSKSKVSTTKTKSSERIIFLDDETIKELKSYRELDKFVSINNGIFTKNSRHYFNGMLTRIYRDFPKLKQIPPHGFRHTHATLLFESDLSAKEIQNRLGHKDITTTLNTYTHITDEKSKETTEKFYKFMSV